MARKKFVILNGPNLNLLGRRQPEIYGYKTFEDHLAIIKGKFPNADILYFQSNHEGVLIDLIHEYGFTVDGFVINAGAYTHTSIALADALRSVTSPAIEVHISNIYEREAFRHVSYMKDACIASIVGRGMEGYDEAIELLIHKNETQS
ncbi:MAG: 3-dehydroquinate dehydratase [Saprospiraceae bacterium]|nr:3-dehydroquinate dehydratase [Saprospiraceae bacterium]MBK8633083.1 3-dehydroquinate dehydratase [Saprospiraceae bacterium]